MEYAIVANIAVTATETKAPANSTLAPVRNMATFDLSPSKLSDLTLNIIQTNETAGKTGNMGKRDF